MSLHAVVSRATFIQPFVVDSTKPKTDTTKKEVLKEDTRPFIDENRVCDGQGVEIPSATNVLTEEPRPPLATLSRSYTVDSNPDSSLRVLLRNSLEIR